MAIEVQRTGVEHGTHGGRPTLVQRFRFRGDVSADAIAHTLMHAPLVGERSVFGARPGREEPTVSGGPRILRGFSPAPGFRFDVVLTRIDDTFVVQFSQPGRPQPYLQGELAWILEDHPDGAVLDEQINTDRALALVNEPLAGPRPSLRRWLFFRVGHARVMRDATRSLAELVDG